MFVEKNGLVDGLVESEVENREGKIWATPLGENNWKEISENTLVSMNMFGFTGKLMERLDADTIKFFSEENLEKAEFLIPLVVDSMMKENEIKLSVEKTTSKWYGITYKEDLENFKNAINNMIKDGQYPEHLYK